MPYFSGEYEAKLDPKGRMVLPARLKAALGAENEGKIVIIRGFEPCLVIYPQVEWQKVFEKVAALNEFVTENRNFQRNFLRGNTEAELDDQGRFLVPKTMLKYADLDKEAIIVGVANRIEIWNSERYEEFLIKDQEQLAQLAEKILGEKVEL